MNAYAQYQKGKLLQKEGEKLCNEVSASIVGFVKKATDRKVENDFGRFQIVDNSQYEYSTQVIELEAKVRKLKQLERENEVAKPIIKPVLRYTFIK